MRYNKTGNYITTHIDYCTLKEANLPYSYTSVVSVVSTNLVCHRRLIYLESLLQHKAAWAMAIISKATVNSVQMLGIFSNQYIYSIRIAQASSVHFLFLSYSFCLCPHALIVFIHLRQKFGKIVHILLFSLCV